MKSFYKYTGPYGPLDLSKLPGMISRNANRPLISALTKLVLVQGGKSSRAWFALAIDAIKHLSDIKDKQGLPGLVKYLKVHSVVLQQIIAGHKLEDLTPLGPRVARNSSGLPRFIPAVMRRRIKSGDPLAIRFYLTIFSIYRDLEIPGKIKLSTITDPFTGREEIFEELSKYIPRFTALVSQKAMERGEASYIAQRHNRKSIPKHGPVAKWKGTDILRDRFTIFPISKSSPTSSYTAGEFSTHPASILRSGMAITSLPQVLRALIDVADYSGGGRILAKLIFKLQKFNSSKFWPMTTGDMMLHLGKLGLKQEAAGKMRVFAMVDPFTQWALRPIHKFLFGILRGIPMDGTFDQLRPINRAWQFKSLFSLDLSAATDRLPIRLQTMLLSRLFSPELAKAWETLLVGRPYRLPRVKNPEGATLPKFVMYSVGQPMGALSSWAMLAYTHHFIVQCAAWSVGACARGSLFRNYAVLGDDIVIYNKSVAHKYLEIIRDLGVECGLAKSVLSYKGIGLEFAKKTFYRGVNVSPTPLREFVMALKSYQGIVAYGKTYNLTKGTLVKILGFGYRVLGGLDRPLWKQNVRVRTLLFILMIPTSGPELLVKIQKFSRQLRSLANNDHLKDFVKSLMTSAYKRVLYTPDKYDLKLNSSALLKGYPSYVQEVLEDLRLLLLQPYVQMVKFQYSELQHRFERLKIADHVGIWRLYSEYLNAESRMASFSLTILDMIRADEPKYKSLDPRDARLWRQFGETLARMRFDKRELPRSSESSVFGIIFHLMRRSLPFLARTKLGSLLLKSLGIVIIKDLYLFRLRAFFLGFMGLMMVSTSLLISVTSIEWVITTFSGAILSLVPLQVPLSLPVDHLDEYTVLAKVFDFCSSMVLGMVTGSVFLLAKNHQMVETATILFSERVTDLGVIPLSWAWTVEWSGFWLGVISDLWIVDCVHPLSDLLNHFGSFLWDQVTCLLPFNGFNIGGWWKDYLIFIIGYILGVW
jgi:hypothetical protein